MLKHQYCQYQTANIKNAQRLGQTRANSTTGNSLKRPLLIIDNYRPQALQPLASSNQPKVRTCKTRESGFRCAAKRERSLLYSLNNLLSQQQNELTGSSQSCFDTYPSEIVYLNVKLSFQASQQLMLKPLDKFTYISKFAQFPRQMLKQVIDNFKNEKRESQVIKDSSQVIYRLTVQKQHNQHIVLTYQEQENNLIHNYMKQQVDLFTMLLGDGQQFLDYIIFLKQQNFGKKAFVVKMSSMQSFQEIYSAINKMIRNLRGSQLQGG